MRSGHPILVLLLFSVGSLLCCFKDKSGQGTSASAAQQTDRPILHFDIANEDQKPDIVFAADYADGRRFGTLRGVGGPTWAPDGNWFACVGEDRVGHTVLNLMNLDGKRRTIFAAGEGQQLTDRFMWSPDGERIAAIVLVEPKSGIGYAENLLVVLSADSGKVLSRHNISQETMHLPSPFTPANNFRWSPDGRKILISWENAVVVDTSRNRIETISASPVVAEWAPDSNAIYYLEIVRADKPNRRMGGFYQRNLDSNASVRLLKEADVRKFGLTMPGIVYGVMTLSPSGSKLAVAAGSTKGTPNILHLYDLRKGQPPALDKPSQSFPMDRVITTLQWSPDEKSLAAFTLRFGLPGSARPEPPVPTAVEVLDLGTGQWKSVSTLALPAEWIDALNSKILSWTY